MDLSSFQIKVIEFYTNLFNQLETNKQNTL